MGAASAAVLINWIVPALSAGGDVLGMHTTVVKPPAAPAWEPVRIVSLWVWPGSRKWTWMSTRPGHTTRPLASMTLADFFCAGERLFTNLPSAMKTSPLASRFEAGSITRPFLIQRRDMRKVAGGLVLQVSGVVTCSGWPPAQR